MAFSLNNTSGKGNQVITVTAGQNDGTALSRILTVRTNGGVVRTVMLTQKALRKIKFTTINNENIPCTVSLNKLYFYRGIEKTIGASIRTTSGEDTEDFDASDSLKDFDITIDNKPYKADWSLRCEIDSIVYVYHNNKLVASLDVKKGLSYPFSTNDINDTKILQSDSNRLIGFDMGMIEVNKTAAGSANLSFSDIVEKTPSLYWYDAQYWGGYWDKTGDSDNYVMTAKGSNCSLSFNPRTALEDQMPNQAVYVFTVNMGDCNFESFANCEEFAVGDGDHIEVTFIRSVLNDNQFTVKVRFVPMEGDESSEESTLFSLDSDITIMYSYENLTVSEQDGNSWTYDIGGIGDFRSTRFLFPENTRMTDASVAIEGI